MAKASKNGHLPKNRIASRVYHETYGRLLAQSDIEEVKSAKYGLLSKFDRLSDLVALPDRSGYTNWNRKKTYEKALHLYSENELARAIINLRTSATFYPGLSNPTGVDVRGSNRKLVDTARSIINFNSLNFNDLAREAELAGDVFLHFEANGDQTRIFSLDAASSESVLGPRGVMDVTGFELDRGTKDKSKLSVQTTEHLKFNSTTTSQYGRSVLKPVFYWLDVLDTLFEKNWLRGAQYFGNPQLAIIGVPGPYQAAIQAQLEGKLQRAGRVLILPPEASLVTPDYSLNFPIEAIIGWVFRIVTIATETPVTLLGTADAASRGNAFYANSRFILTIKPIREVWRIGLRNFFIKIFKQTELLKDDQYPSAKEFDFGFYAPFERDLSDIASIIEIYRDRKMISKQSAQEILGLDKDDEEARMKEEPEDDPIAPDPSDPNAPPRVKNGTPANVS